MMFIKVGLSEQIKNDIGATENCVDNNRMLFSCFFYGIFTLSEVVLMLG